MIRALVVVSAALAVAYGVASPQLHVPGEPTYVLAALKTSGIALLALIALMHRARLLATALAFGALGDWLLALDTRVSFMAGALAFLIGHLFYIVLFLRAGIGPGAALRQPVRVAAMLALIVASFAMTTQLVPAGSPLFVPLGLYTVVLTLMTLTSFTLPATRWLAMAGTVLFLISDGFVAANMFHPQSHPVGAFAMSFVGWMIYWAGQAAICFGALGLHKPK